MIGQRGEIAALLERLLPAPLAVWDVDYSQVPTDYLLAVHLSCADDPLRRTTVGYMPFGLNREGVAGWCRDFADFAVRALGH